MMTRVLLALALLLSGCAAGAGDDALVLLRNLTDAPTEIEVVVRTTFDVSRTVPLAAQEELEFGDVFDAPGAFMLTIHAGEHSESAMYDSEHGRIPPWLVACVRPADVRIVASMQRDVDCFRETE